MKKILLAAIAVAGLTFLTGNTAEAGHRHRGVQIGIGGPGWGIGFRSGHRHHRHIRSPWRRGHRHGWYHNTGHFDYHPPSWQRHGNHFDYVPGHYDYHDTGHWHH